MDAGASTTTTAAAYGVAAGPQTRYVGLALLLCWTYSVWFVTSPVSSLVQSGDTLVLSRVTTTLTSVVVPLLFVWRLGRTARMPVTPALIWTSAVLSSTASAVSGLLDRSMPNPWPYFVVSLTTGTFSAIMWLMWGQRLADQAADFAIEHIAPVYGGLLLVTVIATAVIPNPARSLVIAAYPLASGLLLHLNLRLQTHARAPRLLPRATRDDARHPIVTAAVASATAAFTCFLLVMIIPLTNLLADDYPFAWGVTCGAILILAYAGVRLWTRRRGYNFSPFAWLLLPTIAACATFLATPQTHLVEFLLALATCLLLELLLVRFMGVLTLRGYLSPLVAFAISRSAFRFGVTLAIIVGTIFARMPQVATVALAPTFVVLIVVLGGFAMTMVRQEYAIHVITTGPPEASDLDAMVDSVATEFQLSEREREIVALIGLGYSAAAVAEKLVISPHTVNTHVQHIYAKLGIHKRSELIAYLRRNA
ncbi:regulatory LuxR family protein [Propionicimonas paludicola]|uniref:Regulatory LuxR family protein n=1 Tax=Propionicimonas paludicola TaxID=185243 RepID=A0A2A9CU97_9ACTN|nr:LuxR C-terminal-related transcriptional regulator [Propionicimonas paludicola]PFG17129.1 regulatory LuxR family protein [Propionicimonas paludicola]